MRLSWMSCGAPSMLLRSSLVNPCFWCIHLIRTWWIQHLLIWNYKVCSSWSLEPWIEKDATPLVLVLLLPRILDPTAACQARGRSPNLIRDGNSIARVRAVCHRGFSVLSIHVGRRTATNDGTSWVPRLSNDISSSAHDHVPHPTIVTCQSERLWVSREISEKFNWRSRTGRKILSNSKRSDSPLRHSLQQDPGTSMGSTHRRIGHTTPVHSSLSGGGTNEASTR